MIRGDKDASLEELKGEPIDKDEYLLASPFLVQVVFVEPIGGAKDSKRVSLVDTQSTLL